MRGHSCRQNEIRARQQKLSCLAWFWSLLLLPSSSSFIWRPFSSLKCSPHFIWITAPITIQKVTSTPFHCVWHSTQNRRDSVLVSLVFSHPATASRNPMLFFRFFFSSTFWKVGMKNKREEKKKKKKKRRRRRRPKCPSFSLSSFTASYTVAYA